MHQNHTMKLFNRNTIVITLFLLTTLGAFLRLSNLSWGEPYFFHPDERNIASAISQLSFPDNLNPNFFAYGTVPIYLVYFLGIFGNLFQSFFGHPFTFAVSFEAAILLLRLFSAIFSILLIPMLYLLGKKLHGSSVGVLAAFLGMTSIGLIQYAHFGTFEMWLTFFSVILFWLQLQWWKVKKKRYFLLICLVAGFLVSIKVSSLALFPLLLIQPQLWREVSLREKGRQFLTHALLLCTFSLGIFLLTNPFSVLDYQAFLNSMNYESAVAAGSLQVFYTGEFVKTIPLLYQLTSVYPFLLNPLLTTLFLPSLVVLIFLTIKKRDEKYLLLLLYFFVLFFSQAIFFVKWTRYLIPTLPFFYLICALVLSFLFSLAKTLRHRQYLITIGGVFGGGICLIFTVAFFKTVYLAPDTRIQAADWADNHLPSQPSVLSEVYDLGILPFDHHFSAITLFNFYDLDNTSEEFNETTLKEALEEHDVIILPSQRIVKSRLLHPEEFPVGAAFYAQLLAGKTNFSTIYQTPCDFWCQMTYWGDPIFNFEGTVSVFDRPTVFIFTKQPK